MKNREREFFVGIDLGGRRKKTTGICILKNGNFFRDYCQKCKDVKGKDIFKIINPHFKNTGVIAIDAPLTKGRGKGKFRLYEKFLSTKIFRQEKVNPIPPALMPQLVDFARDIVKKLETRGFVLDLNLIEVFPTLIKKISKENLFLRNFPCPVVETPKQNKFAMRQESHYGACQTENQKSAITCAQIAFLHSQFKTRYLGYKDGFLFLPEISFWKNSWQKKFYQAWKEKPKFKYKHLITNIRMLE